MFCPNCGAESPDGKKFCENCGLPLKLQAEQPKQQGSAPQQQGGHQPAQSQQPHKQGYTSFQGRSAQPHYSSQGGKQSGSAPQQPSGNAPSGSKPGKSGKFPVAFIIIAAVLIIGLIVTVTTCSAVVDVVSNSGGGSTANGSASHVYQGSEPAVTEAEAAKSNETWTILFYLCGSNLETEDGLATYNLQELAQADLGKNVTVVVEAGGARRWQNTAFDARYLNRAVFRNGDFEIADKLPTASMAESDTLADFVTWGTANYPADHYMIIFWDHGGGSVLGVCNDELFAGDTSYFGDTLTVTEIDSAFAKAGVTFDVIGFDTCLMATIETATKLAPYGKYMIASEETEPGTGWDYVNFPEWLADHTGTDGNLLGRKICDTYYAKCKKYGVADMATLSVVDLSRMNTLSQAFLGASQELAHATVSTRDLRALTQAAYVTSRFGNDTAYNMVDLGDLMNNSKAVIPEYYDDVTEALSNVVVYQVHGRSRSNVTGLSVFYPLDTSIDEFFYEYLNVAGNVPYAQFLAVMYNKYDEINWSDYSNAVGLNGEEPVEENKIDIKYKESVNSDGQLEIEITDGLEDLALVHIELAIYLEDDNALVYLGTDHNVNNPRTGVYDDNFYGEWMSIDGQYVCANLVEHTYNHNLYSIPVKLNGDYTNLVAEYDFDTKEYTIVCASDDIEENGMSAKSMRELKNGDQIEFVFGAYLFDTGETFTFTMGSTTYSSATKMEDTDLGEGLFLYRFVLTDVLGKEHETDFYVQNYKADGNITVEPLENYFE